MAKRLEILLDDAEYAAIEEAARRQGISVSDWVRHMLRDAPRYELDRAGQKRTALERAAQYNHPTADIDQMLSRDKRRVHDAMIFVDSNAPMYVVNTPHHSKATA